MVRNSRANNPLKTAISFKCKKYYIPFWKSDYAIFFGVQVIEGYSLEHADCMVCDYVGGPLIIRNRRRPAHNQE